MSLNRAVLDQILSDLAKQGYGIGVDLLPRALSEDLSRLARETRADFRAARIGRARLEAQTVRGDAIRWLDGGEGPEGAYLKAMNELRATLAAEFLIALNSYEAHFACYEPGRSYQKHIDRFQGDRSREISTVLFLNPDWTEADRGELVIYEADRPELVARRVLPQLGTIVLFRSATTPHEVSAPRRTRYSIAGWLKCAELALPHPPFARFAARADFP